DDFREVGIDGVSRWNCEFREGIVNLLKFQTAALSDRDTLIKDEGYLAEDTVHFFSRLEVELIRVKLHPVWIVDRLSGLDTQQNVVRPAIILMHVVTIVGCHRANPGPFRDPQHIRNDLALFLETVVVEFQEKAVLTENVAIFRGSLFGLVHTPGEN